MVNDDSLLNRIYSKLYVQSEGPHDLYIHVPGHRLTLDGDLHLVRYLLLLHIPTFHLFFIISRLNSYSLKIHENS